MYFTPDAVNSDFDKLMKAHLPPSFNMWCYGHMKIINIEGTSKIKLFK